MYNIYIHIESNGVMLTVVGIYCIYTYHFHSFSMSSMETKVLMQKMHPKRPQYITIQKTERRCHRFNMDSMSTRFPFLNVK